MIGRESEVAMRALILVALLVGCSGDSVPHCDQCGESIPVESMRCPSCLTLRGQCVRPLKSRTHRGAVNGWINLTDSRPIPEIDLPRER